MSTTPDPQTQPERPKPTGAPSRRALAAVVGPIILLLIASNVGNAIAPGLLPVPGEPERSSNPLLLLALTPQIRNQIGVVNYLDIWVFVLVGSLRLLAADPFFFLLGRWYGDSAIHWMERRSKGAGDMLREVERLFSKAGYVLVFIAPNNLICLLAGASRMRPAIFWALNITGTVGRLLLIIVAGDMLEDQIDAVLGFIGEYRPWVLGASILIVLVLVGRQTRQGSGEIGQLRRLSEGIRAKEEVTEDQPEGPATGDSEGGRDGDQPR